MSKLVKRQENPLPLCSFQRWFAIRKLGLATTNLPTKFDISLSIHYEDMKGDTKYEK